MHAQCHHDAFCRITYPPLIVVTATWQYLGVFRRCKCGDKISAWIEAIQQPAFRYQLLALVHSTLHDQLAESREVAQTNVEATFKTHVAGGIDNRYKPLVPLVPLPEADSAAPALLVGFTEMFLPAVLS